MSIFTTSDLMQAASIAAWKTCQRPVAYQRAAARNEKRRVVRDEITYSKYVGILTPRVLPSGQAIDYEDYLPAPPDEHPEAVVIARENERTARAREAHIRSRLTQRQNVILTKRLEGERPADIARALGVDRATITREIAKIQTAAQLTE